MLPYTISDGLRIQLGQLLGLSHAAEPYPYACNAAFYKRMSQGLGEAIGDAWVANGGRRLEFITITPEDWVTEECAPTFDLKLARSQVTRWMRRMGISGIGIIETVPIRNYPGVRGRKAIAFHVHIIGFAEHPTIYNATAKKLRLELDLKRTVGLPALVTKPIKLTRADAAYTGAYVAKVCYQTKKVVRKKNGKPTLLQVPNSRLTSLRCLEIMSYLSPSDLIVTVNYEGGKWRKQALAKVGPVGRQRPPIGPFHDTRERLWEDFWREIRQRTKSKKMTLRIEQYQSFSLIR